MVELVVQAPQQAGTQSPLEALMFQVPSVPSARLDIAVLATCQSCSIVAPGFCIEHTCPDCLNPTTTVHGSDGEPCPPRYSISSALRIVARRVV